MSNYLRGFIVITELEDYYMNYITFNLVKLF